VKLKLIIDSDFLDILSSIQNLSKLKILSVNCAECDIYNKCRNNDRKDMYISSLKNCTFSLSELEIQTYFNEDSFINIDNYFIDFLKHQKTLQVLKLPMQFVEDLCINLLNLPSIKEYHKYELSELIQLVKKLKSDKRQIVPHNLDYMYRYFSNYLYDIFNIVIDEKIQNIRDEILEM
jgi:hypothetical protein